MKVWHKRGSAAAEHRPIPEITDEEFELFQGLIHRKTGIYLSPLKKALLVSRLAGRLGDLRLESFKAYYRRVTSKAYRAEERVLIDCISTNETHFFREPQQFDYIRDRLIPGWKSRRGGGNRHIRVWSAGCSTGEEPYSIAMLLLSHLPPAEGWRIDVLATDISTRAIERARRGVWSLEKAREIPERYLKAFMLRGTRSNEGKMMVTHQLRSAVRWQCVNLNDEGYPVSGPFDLILCRNVLIYFDEVGKARVIERLQRHLAERGYLFLGSAENLRGSGSRLRGVSPAMYCLSNASTDRSVLVS